MRLSVLVVFLLRGVRVGIAEDGRAGCKCVEWHGMDKFLTSNSKNLRVQIAGENSNVYEYAPDYGSVFCKAWDETEPPYCAEVDGTPKKYPPEWCRKSWCYVDKNACSLPFIYQTTYFPGENLWYSYATCGSTNSFSSWVAAGGLIASADGEGVSKLVELIDGYARSSRDAIEKEYAETTSLASSSCQLTSGCACPACQNQDGWGRELVDFTDVMALSKSDSFRCLGNIIKDNYLRVANLEYDDATRIGFQYAGGQQDGSYMQWPALAWCPANFASETDVPGYDGSRYDPRFRAWYAGAASGPKDVILVLDTSGSMQQHNRLPLTKGAAKRVLSTLTWVDFATVVLFSSEARARSTVTLPMTADWKVQLEAFIDGARAQGSTNFRDAIRLAMDIFSRSRNNPCTSSGCNGAMIFLSDGEPTEWDNSDLQWLASKNVDKYVTFFTFGLGTDAKMQPLIDIANLGKGFSRRVPSADQLGDAMSEYFLTFSDSSEHVGIQQRLRWVVYNDWITGTELFAGCTPFFDERGVNQSGVLPKLLGVTCIDVNMVVSIPTLQQQNGFAAFKSSYEHESKQCSNAKQPPSGEWRKEACAATWAEGAKLPADVARRVVAPPGSATWLLLLSLAARTLLA